MRIIAGKFKNKKLFVPENDDIRPSSARMREALYNVLMHGEFGGSAVINARVADICAGTGALGLEALSRGANHVTFIDENKKSVHLIQKNIAHLNADDACNVLMANAVNLPPAPEPYDLVLADPPYAANLAERVYESIKNQGWIKQGTIFAAELAMQQDAFDLPGATLALDRKYGKTRLCIWRVETV